MKKKEFPPDWPMPHDYLVEFGRIFQLWGLLEANLDFAISKFLGYEGTLDWRAAIVTAHTSFSQRVDIVATLCEELKNDYPHLSDYKKTLGKLKSIQKRRNKLAHHATGYDSKTGKITASSIKARGELKTNTEFISLNELKNISADMHEVFLDIHYLVTQQRYPPMWER